jgi:hypothetical protein
LGCNTLNPKPGSTLGNGPQNGVRNGLFTLKLDLWTAFGYTGFWVYGLFGRGAFGYTGFWVYGLFGTQAALFALPHGPHDLSALKRQNMFPLVTNSASKNPTLFNDRLLAAYRYINCFSFNFPTPALLNWPFCVHFTP